MNGQFAVEWPPNLPELAVGRGCPCDRVFPVPLVNWAAKGGGERLANYLNIALMLSFAVDFLLLLGTNRLTAHPGGTVRCAVGAGLGAVYAGVCLLPGFSFLGELPWRMASLLAMGLISFGWYGDALRRHCVFFLLAMALNGLAARAGREELLDLLVCALLLWGICVLCSGRGNGKQEYQVLKLMLNGKTISMLALLDTGNGLTDPVTGQSVVVISSKAACRLTGLTEEALRTPLETLARRSLPGLRLIPYRTIAGQGLLLGIKIKNAELDGKKKSLLVAFAPENLGNGDVYQALTGGAL